MKRLFILLLVVFVLTSCGDKNRKLQIQTDFGNMTVELFNSTPGHRDNIIKLVKEGFYDDLLFHRVMQNFMIQGGDPNSRGAEAGVGLGNGGPGYTIPHEIKGYHFKGRLAAARTPDRANPELKSSGSQFYIIQGRTVGDQELNGYEASEGISYSEQDRAIYKSVGGRPDLDNKYTVFGQVTEGMEIIDKIAAVQTDAKNRPDSDVKMKIILLN